MIDLHVIVIDSGWIFMNVVRRHRHMDYGVAPRRA